MAQRQIIPPSKRRRVDAIPAKERLTSSSSVAGWIAVLGLILTAATVVASFMQYRAAALQAEVARVQLLPRFGVRAIPRSEGPARFELVSDGGPVRVFDVRSLTQVEFVTQLPSLKATHCLALGGGVLDAQLTGELRGTLTSLRMDLSQEQIQAAFPLMPAFVDTIAIVSYTNAFGEAEDLYIRFHTNDHAQIVPIDEGKQEWDARARRVPERVPVTISEITSKSVSKTWLDQFLRPENTNCQQ